MHTPAGLKAMRFMSLLLGFGYGRSVLGTVLHGDQVRPLWRRKAAPGCRCSAAADEVQQRTGNAVQFKIYAGGVMGDERDMIRKLHIGQIHSAVLTSAGLSNIIPDMDVLQIPFLFNTYDEVDHVLARMGFSSRKDWRTAVTSCWMVRSRICQHDVERAGGYHRQT